MRAHAVTPTLSFYVKKFNENWSIVSKDISEGIGSLTSSEGRISSQEKRHDSAA
jgi:hypothetical protein